METCHIYKDMGPIYKGNYIIYVLYKANYPIYLMSQVLIIKYSIRTRTYFTPIWAVLAIYVFAISILYHFLYLPFDHIYLKFGDCKQMDPKPYYS